jgi:hypothetical protein
MTCAYISVNKQPKQAYAAKLLEWRARPQTITKTNLKKIKAVLDQIGLALNWLQWRTVLLPLSNRICQNVMCILYLLSVVHLAMLPVDQTV